MSSNLIIWVAVAVIAYSVGAVLAFICLFRPYSLVRRQAAFYHRAYKTQAKMTDEQVDRLIKPFWFLFIIDSLSHLVNRGQDHPEEFPRVVFLYRAVGTILFIILLISVALFIIGAVRGVTVAE